MRARIGAGVSALAAALALVLPAQPAAASGPDEPGPDELYLVTLDGPGATGLLGRLALHAEQDRVLASVGGPAPVYRWATALNGVAVRLSADQAAQLRQDPEVALVERDGVRPLAGRTARAGLVPGLPPRDHGGAGVVIGVVDSGIAPESPVFSTVTGLGRSPRGFHGACQTGEGWAADTCTRKVVGARWFVDGFGRDRVRSSESLSARDADGHGTQVASIAAGDSGVTARVGDQRLGTYAGVAPQARLSVYKACWTAPDPHDDGCSTADLVSAIDAATEDGVDVLNLSVGGPAGVDTVERALLGAAEHDVVVVGAAGNAARRFAAHGSPWVTTVGATTGPLREGRVVLADGTSFTGAMASSDRVSARLVVGAHAAAADATRRAARVCTPGSLDAAQVAGHIVLCERGVIGRVDKSAAVAQADGVGMVLANRGPGSEVADFHSVPTVHVDAAAGRALHRYDGRVRLVPLGAARTTPRVAHWSSPGDPTGPVLKPDVVATGSGVLGALPGESSWDLAAGTSVAAAVTSGAAALLVARHPDWSAAAVRSALVTTARTVPGAGPLRAGAGRVVADPGLRPGLVYDVAPGAYRAFLEGDRADLNTPSVVVRGAGTVERTITNVTARRLYFSSTATGFAHHRVRVTPAAVRLGPGESATFRVTVSPGSRAPDDGWVTWRGATGTVTRIPVLVPR